MRTELDLRVRSTDMDGDQVVNNAVFFTYFEQARLEHLRSLSVLPPDYLSKGSRPCFAIAETTGKFRAAARHPDILTVRAWISGVATRSFTMAYEVVNTVGTLIAEGTSVQVWLDEDGHPAALPEQVQRALQGSM